MALLTHDKIASVSIHGQTYNVNDDGFFDVPDDIAGELISTFGLVAEDAAIPQRPKYYAHWKIEELKAEAERLGIEVPKTKAALIEAIKAALKEGAGE